MYSTTLKINTAALNKIKLQSYNPSKVETFETSLISVKQFSTCLNVLLKKQGKKQWKLTLLNFG